jgi:hypothetical protein
VVQNGSPEFPLEAPVASRGEVPLGQMEGSPASAYMIQANSDVTSIRATWPDGFVDEMAPVNGWAIVAHNTPTGANTIEAVLSDGSTLAVDGFESNSGYSYPAQCSPPPPPPPELPPAGEEQPADADSARQSITEAYEYVFTAGNDKTQNAQYVENSDALKAPADQATQNFPEASATITVDVGEIRFLSATEAALYFELKYNGGVLFGQQIGYAKVIDGRWKIEYATNCMVLGWAGAQCDPPPDPEKSRSAGNAPQPGTYFGPAGTESGPAPTTTAAPN